MLPRVYATYECYIEWDNPGSDVDISYRIGKLKHPKCIYVDDHGAGPCWNAYVIVKGTRKDSVSKHAAKVLRLLRRYKAVKIVQGIQALPGKRTP